MKLTFVGAAHEVTGSCHFLQVAGKNVLVDCGMEQGPDLYENPGLPISATEVDYVFLTHAHIDHSGMLPKLAKDGFKGQIFTTYATADLCGIMLRDSAHIQEFVSACQIITSFDTVLVYALSKTVSVTFHIFHMSVLLLLKPDPANSNLHATYSSFHFFHHKFVFS